MKIEKKKKALSGNQLCSEDQRIYTQTKMRISHVHPFPFFPLYSVFTIMYVIKQAAEEQVGNKCQQGRLV